MQRLRPARPGMGKGGKTMAADGVVVIKLSDLVDDQEAVCFAALVKKTRGTTKANQPFIKCLFRDKRVTVEAAALARPSVLSRMPNRGRRERRIVWRCAASFMCAMACRSRSWRIRRATDQDTKDGFDFFDLVPNSVSRPTSSRKRFTP